MGGAINLANALTTVGIDTWLGNTFGASMASLISNPFLFVFVIATVALLARFIIVDMTTCYTLFIVILDSVLRTGRHEPLDRSHGVLLRGISILYKNTRTSTPRPHSTQPAEMKGSAIPCWCRSVWSSIS